MSTAQKAIMSAIHGNDDLHEQTLCFAAYENNIRLLASESVTQSDRIPFRYV